MRLAPLWCNLGCYCQKVVVIKSCGTPAFTPHGSWTMFWGLVRIRGWGLAPCALLLTGSWSLCFLEEKSQCNQCNWGTSHQFFWIKNKIAQTFHPFNYKFRCLHHPAINISGPETFPLINSLIYLKTTWKIELKFSVGLETKILQNYLVSPDLFVFLLEAFRRSYNTFDQILK